MAFLSRGGGGTGRFLEWKIRLFFVAAVLLMVGIARDLGWLVLLAIAVLAVAFLLRFFEREPSPPSEEGEEDVDAHEAADASP